MKPLTFVVIGSSRSGTTTLRHCLRRHPDVFLPKRIEPRFFAIANENPQFAGPGDDMIRRRVVADWDDFCALYRPRRGEAAVGDSSPAYLSSRTAAAAIAQYAPDAKIIAILRDPVERAISSFRLQRLDGFEPVATLDQALDLEPQRLSSGWSYVWGYQQRGEYFRHLRRYYEFFAPENITTFLYDDWASNNGTDLVSKVCEVIGVSPRSDLIGRIPRLNSTTPERFKTAGRLWYEPSPEVVMRLATAYASQNQQLADLIGRDLSAWLRPT